MLKTDTYDYYLPKELIAQNAIKTRHNSKLLVLNCQTKTIEHFVFKDILQFFSQNDLLVFNDTKVIPARFYGEKADTRSKIEILAIEKLNKKQWLCFVKPLKKLQIASKINFFKEEKLIARAIVTEKTIDGKAILNFSIDLEKIMACIGILPLPPYIKNKKQDKSFYQTVYAKNQGAIAAPTAGLHFSQDLLLKAKDLGLKQSFITLHTGIGTFEPLKTDNILDHKIHSEYFTVEQKSLDLIEKTKLRGKKVIAVGTTSIRTLETLALNPVKLSGFTDLFIYPGFDFKLSDILITNFHLPKSTLLVLLHAFLTHKLKDRDDALDFMFKAYKIAIDNQYRFFSLGDAMLIL